MQISDAIFYLILAYPDKYLKEYISSFSEIKENLQHIQQGADPSVNRADLGKPAGNNLVGNTAQHVGKNHLF